MLVAFAVKPLLDLSILTADTKLAEYPVQTLVVG
jgi:hypothetical protein